MNKIQKLLSLVTMGVFCVSVLNAPWEPKISVGETTEYLETIYSPIWNPPVEQLDNPLATVNLRIDLLVMEWLALGIVHGGLFLLLRKSKE